MNKVFIIFDTSNFYEEIIVGVYSDEEKAKVEREGFIDKEYKDYIKENRPWDIPRRAFEYRFEIREYDVS